MIVQFVRATQIALPLALFPALALAQAALPSHVDRSEPLAPPQADVKTLPVLAPAEAALERPAMTAAGSQAARPTAVKQSASTGSMQVDHSRMYFDTDHAGAIWARGAGYKMRFDAGGADFVPFFGSSAPHDFDVGVHLVSASVGATEIDLDASMQPTRAGDVVTYDRGEIDEVFELSPRQVEHEFVLASLPCAGDVHVRVAFDGELAASADDEGWRFANEYGHVHYGRATAIDAAGRELALTGELAGNVLDFVVPADFAARATLPLVIDPVMIAYTVEGNPIQSLNPDVVYDWSGGYAMHCWEQVYSQSDHDVYSVIYDVNGGIVGSTGGYIDVSTSNWARPRCAYLPGTDHYGFVAEVGSVGYRQIWGLVRTPYWTYSSGQFQVADPGLFNEAFNADIGADPYTGGPAFFCAVYQRSTPYESDIHAQLISSGGAPSGGTIYIDNSLLTFNSLPSISKTDDTRDWNVVWQRQVGSGLDIYGARVHWQGSITTAAFPIATAASIESNPSVSGPIEGTNRFVVAYENDYITDHDILVALMDNATKLTLTDLSVSEGSTFMQDQRYPTVESDGAHFACTYSELYGSSTTDYDPYIAEFSFSGNSFVLGEGHTYLAYTYAPEVQTTIASRRSSNLNGAVGQYVTAWSSRDGAIGGNDGIRAATFNGRVGGPISSFCGGSSYCPCGNSQGGTAGCPNSVGGAGLLTALGNASTTADSLTLEYSGLPHGVSALLFQGWSVIGGGLGTPFGDGVRCVNAPVYRFPIRQANGSGVARFGYGAGDGPISAVGSVPLAGGTYYYQVWYRDTGAFCTSAVTNFTNALSVSWTP